MTKENYGPYWLTESKICPLTGDEVLWSILAYGIKNLSIDRG